MDRPRLAYQPLVAGLPTLGDHGQPCRWELAGLSGQAAEQLGQLAAEFQNHERGGTRGRLVKTIVQRSRFPDADARLG
jgi:hypothetical protein